MNVDDIKKFICKEDIPLIEAIKKIDSNAKGILFVVGGNNKFLGTITDGDVRRELIKNGNLSIDIGNIYNKNPKYVYEKDKDNAYCKMLEYKIFSIPVLNSDNEIVDIYFINDDDKHLVNCIKGNIINVPVIIMAGGKGTRLYPYTKILPKPLIPISGTPIIERIIDEFRKYSVKKFYITVNYKKNMIMSYFNEFDKNYEIKYVEEDKPLGTAGSIRLIKDKFNRPVFVINCDILINANYESIYEYHVDSKNDITIVASLKNIIIPYGVLNTEKEGRVVSMVEKPSMSYFINTGMYVVNDKLFEKIPEDKVFHMPDLVKLIMNDGGKVGIYPISEDNFLDMGELNELKRMENKLGQ